MSEAAVAIRPATTTRYEQMQERSLLITCPWCGAKPQKPCHVAGKPERVWPTPHEHRMAIFRAVWHEGWTTGWRAHEAATANDA